MEMRAQWGGAACERWSHLCVGYEILCMLTLSLSFFYLSLERDFIIVMWYCDGLNCSF